MSKAINAPVAYFALILFGVGYVLFMVLYVMPILYPTILQGHYWLLWLVPSIFGMPLGFMIYYVVTRAINYEYKEWRQAVTLMIPTLLLSTLYAFLFNLILPVDFEPFRSLLLPVMAFSVTFTVVARLRYRKKGGSLL